MVPVPTDGIVADGVQRYRLLEEGTIEDFDGFTIGTPSAPEGLDMNRNFPAGWGTSGAWLRRPSAERAGDRCAGAGHRRPARTSAATTPTTPAGGVLLRPSSTASDSTLPPLDVWTFKELGARGTELTSYRVHSVYEDFTWDKTDTMSGAADDWAYEHLGVYGWTTEFWDVVTARQRAPQQHRHLVRRSHARAGAGDRPLERPVRRVRRAVAPLRPPAARPGRDRRARLVPRRQQPAARSCWWTRSVRTPSSPCSRRWPRRASRSSTPPPYALGDGLWRIEVGIANTGWLPTTVSVRAAKSNMVLPIWRRARAARRCDDRRRAEPRHARSARRPQRASVSTAAAATTARPIACWPRGRCAPRSGVDIGVTASHPRAGTRHASITVS